MQVTTTTFADLLDDNIKEVVFHLGPLHAAYLRLTSKRMCSLVTSVSPYLAANPHPGVFFHGYHPPLSPAPGLSSLSPSAGAFRVACVLEYVYWPSFELFPHDYQCEDGQAVVAACEALRWEPTKCEPLHRMFQASLPPPSPFASHQIIAHLTGETRITCATAHIFEENVCRDMGHADLLLLQQVLFLACEEPLTGNCISDFVAGAIKHGNLGVVRLFVENDVENKLTSYGIWFVQKALFARESHDQEEILPFIIQAFSSPHADELAELHLDEIDAYLCRHTHTEWKKLCVTWDNRVAVAKADGIPLPSPANSPVAEFFAFLATMERYLGTCCPYSLLAPTLWEILRTGDEETRTEKEAYRKAIAEKKAAGEAVPPYWKNMVTPRKELVSGTPRYMRISHDATRLFGYARIFAHLNLPTRKRASGEKHKEHHATGDDARPTKRPHIDLT